MTERVGSLQRLREFDLVGRLRDNDTIRSADDLRVLLAAALEESRSYSVGTASLTSHRDALRTNQDALERQIELGRSFLAPVRRLPVEILAEIFEAACLDGFSGLLPYESPVVLNVASVCFVWRTVAIETPQLWARLLKTAEVTQPLDHDGTHRFYHGFTKRFLEGMLDRTQSIPLELGSIDNVKTLELFAPALLGRCHECDFVEPETDSDLEHFLKAMPSLCSSRMGLANTSADMDMSSLVPNLRRVSISELHHNIILPTRLTSLELYYSDYGALANILSHTSSLQHLAISYIKMDGIQIEAEQPSSSIRLDHLRSLYLRLLRLRHYGTAFDHFLNNAVTPNLSTLSLRSKSHPQDPIPASIFTFLKHCRASVKTLLLENVYYPMSTFTSILRSLSSLNVLGYSCDDTSSAIESTDFGDIVHMLDVRPSRSSGGNADESLLPQLTQLDITLPGSSFTDQELVDMISSRWRSEMPVVATLQSVKVVIRNRRFDDTLWDTLHHKQEKGLRIGIRDQEGDVRTRVESMQ